MIHQNISELVGETPLLQCNRMMARYGINGALLAKLEYFNPGGSVKDRLALALINAAEASGELRPGGVVIEATSGNTGIGLAAIAASRGYRAILTMPETMSIERRKLLAAYGAELVLTEGKAGMGGAIERAEQLHTELTNSILLHQFENPANPQAHRVTTGPELWRQTEGKLDLFVACVGTGGTITGTGEFLKSKNPSLRVVAVEPAGSPVLSGGQKGPHGLQGIGAGFVPKALNTAIYDEIIRVSEAEAYEKAREFARNEGILVGITSGAALHAAILLAGRPENEGKTIAVILPDTGERYLSSALFAEEG